MGISSVQCVLKVLRVSLRAQDHERKRKAKRQRSRLELARWFLGLAVFSFLLAVVLGLIVKAAPKLVVKVVSIDGARQAALICLMAFYLFAMVHLLVETLSLGRLIVRTIRRPLEALRGPSCIS